MNEQISLIDEARRRAAFARDRALISTRPGIWIQIAVVWETIAAIVEQQRKITGGDSYEAQPCGNAASGPNRNSL